MKTINYLKMIVALACLIFLIQMSGSKEDKPITIASTGWIGYQPMLLARDEGWLNPKHVTLLETKSSTDSLQALIDDKVDGAALTLDEVLHAKQTGIPLMVVMVFDISVGADVLLAKPHVKKISDLKGKRIGHEHCAVGELMLRQSLVSAGLANEDVKAVNLTPDKHLAAWSNQQVDAIVTYEPYASQLRAQGAVTLFDSRQTPNMVVDVLAIRSDKLDESRADALRHLIAAHLKAVRHLQQNPQDSAYRLSRRMGLPASEVLPAFKGLILSDAENNHRLLQGLPSQIQLSVIHLQKLMLEERLLFEVVSVDGLVSDQYLPTLAISRGE